MTVLYTDKETIEFLSSSSPPQKKGGRTWAMHNEKSYKATKSSKFNLIKNEQ